MTVLLSDTSASCFFLSSRCRTRNFSLHMFPSIGDFALTGVLALTVGLFFTGGLLCLCVAGVLAIGTVNTAVSFWINCGNEVVSLFSLVLSHFRSWLFLLEMILVVTLEIFRPFSVFCLVDK